MLIALFLSKYLTFYHFFEDLFTFFLFELVCKLVFSVL